MLHICVAVALLLQSKCAEKDNSYHCRQQDKADRVYFLAFYSYLRKRRKHADNYQGYPIELRRAVCPDMLEIEFGQYHLCRNGKYGGKDQSHYYGSYAFKRAADVSVGAKLVKEQRNDDYYYQRRKHHRKRSYQRAEYATKYAQ